jgi:hypothetical protein
MPMNGVVRSGRKLKAKVYIILFKENPTNASLEVSYLEMEVSGVTGKGDGAGGKWGACFFITASTATFEPNCHNNDINHGARDAYIY